MKKFLLLTVLAYFAFPFSTLAGTGEIPLAGTGFKPVYQDTVRISLREFIRRGVEKSGQLRYEQGAVAVAENRIDAARANRILPDASLNTIHGLIPGVKNGSDDPLEHPPHLWYLEPNLVNDWENWAIFTRAEMTAVQPLFAWGAINKAIAAAELGAEAARKEYEAKQTATELQLFELYYSYLLALEIERILVDAEGTVEEVERQIARMQEEGDPALKERDVFQFEIYRSEFEVQKTEVREGKARIERIWNYILGDGNGVVWLPDTDFLEEVPYEIRPYDFYRTLAMASRPEMKGVEAGMQAYRNAVEAVKASGKPVLFIGLTASYAYTPNRPRQRNPFIINNTNFASAGFGFGIRQSLNFGAIRNRIEREEIEFNRVRDLKNAIEDGIVLELNERYMQATVAGERVQRIREALVTTRNWVRHEQLNYDFGIGEVEDLVDSVRKELELRVELQQRIFELNLRMAALYRAAGLPVESVTAP